MQTDIVIAKKSLYERLKSFGEVSGAAIQERDGRQYIVIFLSKATKSILEKIPKEFEGNKVEAHVKGAIHAL